MVRRSLELGRLRPHLALLRGQGWELAGMLTLMLASTAVGLAIPLVAGRFVDALKPDVVARYGSHVALLSGLLVLQLAGSFAYSILARRVGLRTVTRLRRRVFDHLLSLPALTFTGYKPGDLSSRVTSDVGAIQYLLTNGLVAFVRALVTLVGALALMVTLDARLTGVVLLLVPSTILLVRMFGRRLHRLSRKMYDETGQISDHVQEIAGAIRVIKVFNSENAEQGRFQALLDRFLNAGLQRAWLSAALESGAQILLWICMITVVIYGFVLTNRGETTSGELVAFLLLAFRVAVPLGSLTNLYDSAQNATAAAERLDDVLGVAPEEGCAASASLPPASERARPASIELRNVSFAYRADPAAPPVLRGITLRIAAGEKVALVGPSGSGKTTLTGLVMRLFDPTGGDLRLDGRPYRDIPPPVLRARMAYVPQDAVLYDASVADNIRFGFAEATDAQVREAAARAQALAFVDALPDGFATTVGPHGVRLSGGERQRLSLARAFLRDPGVLLLDEPTSALDAASEDQIRRALAELMSGRTVIVVAHRLSLVRDLDRIHVLQEGQLAESGTHDELIARHGLYSILHEFQQGAQLSGPNS